MPGIASLGASSVSRWAVSSRLQDLAGKADLARGPGEAEDPRTDVSGLMNNIYLSRRSGHGMELDSEAHAKLDGGKTRLGSVVGMLQTPLGVSR
jgi:hypothetical protein